MLPLSHVRMNSKGKHDELAERLLQAGSKQTESGTGKNPLYIEAVAANNLSESAIVPTSVSASSQRDWDSTDCVARPLQFFFADQW